MWPLRFLNGFLLDVKRIFAILQALHLKSQVSVKDKIQRSVILSASQCARQKHREARGHAKLTQQQTDVAFLSASSRKAK